MSPPASERFLQPSSDRSDPLSIHTSAKNQINEPTVMAIASPVSEDGSTIQARGEMAQRTFSDPLPAATPMTFAPIASTTVSPLPGSYRRSSLPQQPKSAGVKNLRFALKNKIDENGTGTDSAMSPTMGSPTSRAQMGGAKRRHSSEPKVNLYTECGRHGDEWLFRGFSISGTVKKIWEKEE